MPHSLEEGKSFVEAWIRFQKPSTVLDVGAGAGRYSQMVRSIDPSIRIDAIEVYEPYVDDYGLRDKYDNVFVVDLLDFETETKYDFVLMGDVLEHFSPVDVPRAWAAARRAGKVVACSSPIIEWPQGAMFGNEHEAHLTTFDADTLASLPGVFDTWVGEQIGVVLALGTDM